jgi:cyclic beta-1,2-glucan synthetase
MRPELAALGLSQLESRLLLGGAGVEPIESPIRAVLFGAARFADHGHSLAQAQQVGEPQRTRSTFFPRLRDNIAMLRDARRLLEQHAEQGHHVAPAAMWLVEHGNLLDQQLRDVHRALPKSYFARLPRLQDAPLAGLPRVYGLAWAWVAHTDSSIDENLLHIFLHAYQRHSSLTIGELWAIPTTWRVVLVENLRRLAERAAAAQAARHAAHRWIEAPALADRGALLHRLSEVLQQRGLLEIFALQLQRRIDEWPADGAAAARALLDTHLHDAAGELQRWQQQQAEDHQSVRNAVMALRNLDHIAWRELFMHTSPMLMQLNALPVFFAEAQLTQDQALHTVETLARRHRIAEPTVCDAVAALAQGHGDGEERAAPLYWLRQQGRGELMARLGLAHRDGAARVASAWRRGRTTLYLTTLALGTTAMVAGMLWLFADAPRVQPWAWWLWVSALLLVLPASEFVVALCHRLISESLPPRVLPRLAFEQGIPPSRRVLVVVPAILSNAQHIEALAAQLEQHHLANPERHAQFALLSDLPDADTQTMPQDEALLHAAVQAIEALNRRYPPTGDNASLRFLLMHRQRQWAPTERRWIGWERKRGKLEQLISHLADDTGPVDDGAFVKLGALSRPARDTRSIVTLDSDTDMPPGRLRELVSIAAHPLNTPRLDATGRRVRSGYTVLQPRITVPLPAPGRVTPFYWLFSGQWGVDPYSAASSEIYEDVFEEGSYSGKGLIDIAAAQATLVRRLPEGQVLSHDLLEGALARCSAVSDVTFVEDAPAHPDVAAARLHRWIRGDWQLLPFVLQPSRWPMVGINRWKMIDNLRRSLVAPASVLLLVWALLHGAQPFGAALALVALAYGGGSLISALAVLASHRDELALVPYLRHALRELLRAAAGTLWQLAWLLQQAMVNIDAIGRALVRQAITRRHLLQWTTAASAQAAARHDLAVLARFHLPVLLLSTALLAALSLLRLRGWPVPVPAAVALCLLWAATPLWAWWGARPWRDVIERLGEDEIAYLRQLAQDTWRYYERHVTAADHHLPPDNVQHAPREMVAHRSSPTNIGLYLLAAAAAHRLGLIERHELLLRLRQTLDTLHTLPRWRGHFYNWYDTQTLAVLPPAYVSTVDSGNFSGHLLVLSSACDSVARQASKPERPDECTQWTALADELREMALAADFKPLYDTRRRLFHIGLLAEGERLDASHYDLLASEARLASLVAIAKGDVPPRHWATLGRPLFADQGRVGLKSWSGSMFEYLMPSLVLTEPAGSLLRQAVIAAVAAQRDEARVQGTPWGISECAIAVRDHTLAYQYGPQGAPRLALRRTPADERVIAPYASAMALLVAPRAAIHNLRSLEALGARGEFGFYEALDYSARRQSADAHRPFVLVETFMAHHQAMSLLGCAHVLGDGAVQRWSARQPHLRAVGPLLHERVPHRAEALPAPAEPHPLPSPQRQRWQLDIDPLNDALPAAHLLGNGRHGVMLRANGAGYSQWQGRMLNRWRDDALRDLHGVFAYVRRGPRERWLSLAARPTADDKARYTSEFHPDRVVLHARWDDLHASTSVFVSPEDDCELRRIVLHNTGRKELRLSVAMAFEATLAPAAADESHPAFSNLFVKARWVARDQALYLVREPRLPDEAAAHAVHFVLACDGAEARVSGCADRTRWIGRLRNAARPAFDCADDVADDAGDASTELPTGLDPASVITVQLRLASGARCTLGFGLACAAELEPLEALVDRYRQPLGASRALELSETLAHIRLRELRLDPDTWAAWLTLNSLLVSATSRALSPLAALASPAAFSPSGIDTPASGIDRRLLWRHGIAGDRPLLVVWLPGADGAQVVRQLASLLPLWTAGGLALDLVVINAEPASYLSPAQQALAPIIELAARHDDPQVPQQRRARLHVLPARDLLPAEIATLNALARVLLSADGRPLTQLIERLRGAHEDDRQRRLRGKRQLIDWPVPALDARPPRGAFVDAGIDEAPDALGADFRFDVHRDRLPARPWINVLANPQFGFQVSESGAGFTWAGNSRLQQITAWSNDPLCDPPSELLLLHDLDSDAVWPLGRTLPALSAARARQVTHGIGSTQMVEHIDGLRIELCWCVDASVAVKQLRVRISDSGAGSMMIPVGATARRRHLRLVAFAEWTMGNLRHDRASVVTRVHGGAPPRTDANGLRIDSRQARRRSSGRRGEHSSPGRRFTDTPGLSAPLLLATQSDAGVMASGATAFLGWRAAEPGSRGESIVSADDWTCDRREFFDAHGRWVLPRHLGQRAGHALDACAASACLLQLDAGGRVEATLLLGHAGHADAALRLAEHAFAVPPAQRLARQRGQWPEMLDSIVVRTPDAAFDALVNRWLPYQSIACRLWARAGFYQAGGAFGFRDQLQDAMGVADRVPALLRQQIVLHASHQFEAGDVQHWWHPPGGAGVRTHISDDMLWLPLALAHHLSRQGDAELLDESVPFLQGPPVPQGAEDLYNTPEPTGEPQSVYEHAARAIEHACSFGQHGLPLMGTGDWNDGMNRIGHEGRGESVWLGWFLCHVIDRFTPVAQARGDTRRLARWHKARRQLAKALDAAGWDGLWYRRAYFDDGTPLGSRQNDECRIDLIAQAWAVISGAGQAQRARTAMQSAAELLWNVPAGLMQLLHPPLQSMRPHAGYIQAYPPGIRENGGQYNHGAVWALMAFAQLGDGAAAWRMFKALSPAHRHADPVLGPAYELEPYVCAGDVYSQPPYAARGGWSWYTGSAAWLQRAALESICGVVIEGAVVRCRPCLPPHWPQAEVRVRRGARVHRIVVCRDSAAAGHAARQPGARELAVGQPFDLDAAAEPCVLIVTQAAQDTPVARLDDTAARAALSAMEGST